jgi:hypothetical protein
MPAFRGQGPSSGELKRLLAEDCERAVETILPDCRREGSELRGHGQDGALWVVETRGSKRGLALCTSDPDLSGDLLDLVAGALCGGDLRAAYRWALQYFGGTANRPTPTEALRPDSEKANETDAAKRARYWERYEQGLPGANSAIDEYLGRRGLTRDIIELPQVLRFAPHCPYVKDDQSGRWTHRPAMLAPVFDPITGEFLSLHCTYLEQVGGVWRKVSSDPARKCWGRFGGGVIELSNGASGQPLRDAPEGDGCLVGEGIENVLTANFLRPELRALAAISIGNIPKIALPPRIGLVVLACDDDGEKMALKEIYERAIRRWRHEGRSTEKMVPTRGYKDLNEQLQKELRL